MSAPVLVDAVVIDKRWSDRTGRRRGDHPLFTPQAEDIAASRLVAVPPPAAAERTRMLPRLDENGRAVTAAPAETEATQASAASEAAEIPTGWSEVDNKLHSVDTSLAPLAGGLWWTDCDRLVIRIPAKAVAGVGQGAWCPQCWDLPAAEAVREVGGE